MAEATFQTDTVHFPKTGGTWTPLPRGKSAGRVQAHAVQTINRSPEAIFNVYTRIELLPTWQEGVVSVERTGNATLHWVMQELGTGKQFKFESEELEVSPNKRHVSRITTGPAEGTTVILTLEAHPAGRGTIATLVNDFTVPGGWFSNAVGAIVSRTPEQITIENLRHLKELIEGGEIPTVEGQPAGRRGISGKLKRFLLGEHMPTPPGTSDRARPEDMPKGDAFRADSLWNTAAIVGLVAMPILLGTVIWASLSDD